MDYQELSKLEFTQKANILFDKLREDDTISIEFIIENSDYDENEVQNMSDGDLEFHVRDVINAKDGNELIDLLLAHDY